MQKFQKGFDTLPTPVKIVILNGGAQLLTYSITDIENGGFDWRKYAVIIPTVLLNILAWKLLQYKDEA